MDTTMQDSWTDGRTPYDPEREYVFLHKQRGPVRILGGVTSSLSIIGSLLIILSYVCFKSLRSRTRLILVHISIMDCGLGIANFVGATAYFDSYYETTSCLPNVSYAAPFHYIVCQPSKAIQGLCMSQAGFAHYFNLSSIMWTVCLSAFLYVQIVHKSTKQAKHVYYASLVISYVLPLVLVAGALADNKLGFSPYTSEGWCSVILKDPTTGNRYILSAVINYDLWMYMTLILVLVFSISTHFHIRSELRMSHTVPWIESYRQALQRLDYKFLLIPVAFVVLRMWSSIVVIIFVYAGIPVWKVNENFVHALIYLASIGDSGQGMTNAILFVLFTKKARQAFWRCFTCHRLRHREQNGEEQRILNGGINHERPPPLIHDDHWHGLAQEGSLGLSVTATLQD